MKRPPLNKIYNKIYKPINEQRDSCLQLQTQNPGLYGYCMGHCNSILPPECLDEGFTENCCPPRDEVRWTCNNCKGCERYEDGEFTSEEECEEYGCFSGTLEDYAISLGITPGLPGVSDTIMSAEDQFCIKCQSIEQAGGDPDEKCECCNTEYTYDDNVITHSGQDNQIDNNEIPVADEPKKATAPKRLRESVVKRLQKLANIKKK